MLAFIANCQFIFQINLYQDFGYMCVKKVIIHDAAKMLQFKKSNIEGEVSLLDDPHLKVRIERIPSESEVQWYYEAHAQQYIHLMEGIAEIQLDNSSVRLQKGEGIMIAPGLIFRITNVSKQVLRFSISTSPVAQPENAQAFTLKN